MKISAGILFLIAVAFSAGAQSDSTVSKSPHRIQYFNNISTGVLFGENDNTVTVSTTHGVRIKRFAVGAGIGFDSYTAWRTIPFTASVAYEFWTVKQVNHFYFQGMGGYSRAWHASTNDGEPGYDVSNGPTFGGLLGYRLQQGKTSVYFSAGYRFQRIEYTVRPLEHYYLSDSSYYGGGGTSTHVQRDMERIVVQIGFGLH